MRYHEFNLHKQLTEYVKRTNQPTIYSYQDLYTFENTRIFEQQDSGKWQINYSNAFNRGWKKHKRNLKITAPYDELIKFIVSNPGIPKIEEYPPKFKAHRIHSNNRSFTPNTIQAHLMGSKIILMFEVIPANPDDPNSLNTLNLLHIGTHQEVGQS